MDVSIFNTLFRYPESISDEHEERNIVEQHESQGVIDFSTSKERELYIGFEDYMHNVKPWNTFLMV